MSLLPRSLPLRMAPSHRARLSYLALYSLRRSFTTTTCRPRSLNSSGYDHNGSAYSSIYTPGEPIRGPFGQLPAHEPLKITPAKLKVHLDQFVVGQDRPKKRLSTAVFNHYQRINERERAAERRRIDEERKAMILRAQEKNERDPIDLERSTSTWQENDFSTPEPSPRKRSWSTELEKPEEPGMEKSNLLMLGPTGVGKSLMMKTIARVLDVPFSISDVTAMTQAGYIGQDVESCVERLLVAADYDVARAEKGIIFLDEIDKLATSQSRVSATGRDVGGEGVQQALLKIIEGTTIQVTPRNERGAPRGQGNSGSGGGFGSGFTSSSPSASSPRAEVYNVRTDNILFFLAGAFVGLDKLILNRISKGSLGFGANIVAKPTSDVPESTSNLSAISAAQYRAHSRRYLSERDVSAIQKGEGFNILDLATSADLKAYGFIPEFIGRVPIHVPLNALSLDAMVRILTEPRNCLVAQYTALFKTYDVDLHFTTPALHAIAADALAMGTGARALRTVMEGVLEDSMHHAPGSGIRYVLINEQVAKREAPPLWFGRSEAFRCRRMMGDEEEQWAKRKGGEGYVEEGDEASRAGGSTLSELRRGAREGM